MLLDFKCPDSFARFSVSQVLAGAVPKGALKDRIIILGINTAGANNTASVMDERVTPMRRNHAGVELQAMTVHQIVRHALEGSSPLRTWNDWGEDSWILLWCLIGGAVGYYIRSPWNFTAANVVCILAGGVIAWVAFNHGLWMPLVAPLLGFVPSSGLVVSYMSFHESRQRGHLMQLFAKQVSPDIAQNLWENRHEFLAGQRPRPRKLTATVLFTDLVGFTAISEKLEPAELMDWLNEYMEAMASIIMAHKGVVEKYIGDAIMAVFGPPLARTTEAEIREDARNAVLCALAMASRLRELNELWAARGLGRAGMRVGIHTGSLVAGSLGSADRQEYTVLGDTVNTASRLESFNKEMPDLPAAARDCRILISEATRVLVGEDFEMVRVGAMNLKNKTEPVTLSLVVPPEPITSNKTMKTQFRPVPVAATLAAGFFLALAPGFASAQTNAPAAPATAKSSGQVKFRLQTTAAPSVRVTGGSRGAGDAAIVLDVLAPDQVGTTTAEQPSLFWFQSKPANAKFELTLLQEKKVKPLLQVKVERAAQAGVNRLKLAEHGVKLAPGVEYQWVVALINDPDNRSSDQVASGVIKRVDSTSALKEQLAGSGPNARAAVYAEAGIWYDALAELSDQIDADPGNRELRRVRADLLRQVGLSAAATAEDAVKVN
jgi:class 3 adenylate cyclase